MDEMTINFRDLFYRILLRWRFILIWMLICAVLMNGVGYLRSSRYAKSVEASLRNQNNGDRNLDQLAALRQELSQREKEEVDEFAASYKIYKQYFENSLKYHENSIKMQLDPNAVPTMTVEYYVNNHYEAVYPVVQGMDTSKDIVAAYIEKINNGEIGSKFIEQLGWDTESSYIQELIAADLSSASDRNFRVFVMAPDEESCERIADIVRELVEDETTRLKEVYGDFDIAEVNEQFSIEANATLLAYQQAQATNMNNVKNSITNAIGGLTEAQKNYYYALLENELSEEVEAEGDEKTEDSEGQAVDVVPEVKVINIKYILLGLVVGGFLACCYIAARYLLSSALRVKDDLPGAYGVPVLGSIRITDNSRRLFAFVDHTIDLLFKPKGVNFTEEEHVQMICAGVRIVAKKYGMEKVYITGACNDKETEKAKNMLCEKLKSDISTISYGKSVIYDPESLETLVSSDGVVLVERVGNSPYVDLKKEIDLCRTHGIRVIGSVVLN